MAIIFTYIIITGAYFLNKYHPFVDIKFKTEDTDDKNEVEDDIALNCQSYSIGHISNNGENFRENLRRLFTEEDTKVDEADLANSIASITCDRAGQRALIYYDSVPVATGLVESYDYSKPIAVETKDLPNLYTVLKVENKFREYPKSSYIIAVFDYDQDLLDFYTYVTNSYTKNDEQLIDGNIDTIYYEVIANDPSKTEAEYSSIKTLLEHKTKMELITVLTTWQDPELPKNVNYMTLFNMHIDPKTKKASRYSLFPMTKIRKSDFELFQVLDIDNDGYKETILKKTRSNITSFNIFKYNSSRDIYIELGTSGDQKRGIAPWAICKSYFTGTISIYHIDIRAFVPC
jgi:hypothetical protein